MSTARAWAVVIPSDSEKKLPVSVGSIMNAHPGMDPSRIIVVSKAVSRESIQKEIPGVTLIQDPSPFCFARRVNIGVARADPYDVVVMGDDVEVMTHRAFDILAMEAPLRILAAPVRGRIGPWWQAEGQNHLEVPFVSFTCVYIPRTVLEIVGPLEEGFPGYGYDDTDYCLRARKAGLSCGVVGSVLIEHGVRLPSEFVSIHGATVSTLEDNARKSFADKWKKRST